MANDETQAYRTKGRQVVQRDPNRSPSKEEPSMRHQLQFLRVVFVAIAIFFGLTGIAVAQEITGSIVGTVKDSNGAAVAGATVTVTDSGTKLVVRTVQTNDEGQFTARDLSVTKYDVAVEATNFKKHIETNVQIDVGKRRTLDITLAAGNISEVVSVQASQLAVELATPTVSTIISGTQA